MKHFWRKTAAGLLCLALLLGSAACGGGEEADTGSDGNGLLMDFDDDLSGVQGTGSGDEGAQSGGTGGSGGNGGGAGGTVSNSAGGGAIPGSSSTDPFASIPSNLKGTSITFPCWGDEGDSECLKVINAFTKKTGIKVNVTTVNQGEYESTIAQQIAARSGPDVIVCNNTLVASIDNAQPIQKYVNLQDDFWDDTITDICTLGGNTYFVNSLEGVWENVDMVFYNKKLFEDNGLTSPGDYYKKGTWTWENCKKCMEEINGIGQTGGYIDPLIFGASMNACAVAYDVKNHVFSCSPSLSNLVPAFQFPAQCFREGLWNTTAWFGTFGTGTIGIYVSSTYGFKPNGYFKDMDNAAIAMAPLPSSYQGKTTKQAGTLRGYGIAKGAKNPNAVAYFLRWFLDYKYYESSGSKIFKNDGLKKVYFEQIVPDMRKNGWVVDLSHSALRIADYDVEGSLRPATRVEAAQVSVELAKQYNTINAAVQKANSRIAKYK